MTSPTDPRAPSPLLPSGSRVYAVGDVHGRDDLLSAVFDHIDADRAAFPVSRAFEIYLGDYVDRGPGSREVVDLLTARGRRPDTIFLKGNHETYLTRFLEDPAMLRTWRRFGGLETLMSYGLRPSLVATAEEEQHLSTALRDAMPATHHAFLGRLTPFTVVGGFFFVHAGVKPGVPLDRQRESDLLWIRDEFLEHDGPYEKTIVHGHTPVRAPDFRFNRINIDTGAYATGRLTCLVIERDGYRVL